MDYATTPLRRPPVRRLTTPRVTTRVVRQDVDLNPSGNTIAVRTAEENPYARDRRNGVTVVTQASPGMSPAPESMKSRRLMANFMPGIAGLGETPPENTATTSNGSVWSTISDATSGAISVLGEREQRKRAEAEATSAQALSQARALEAEAQKIRAEKDSYLAQVASSRGSRIFFGIAAVAGAAALLLTVMKSKTGPASKTRRKVSYKPVSKSRNRPASRSVTRRR